MNLFNLFGMKKILIFLFAIVVCLSLSSCHYAQMAFDAPIVKDSLINKLILISWYLCTFIVFLPVGMSLDKGLRGIREALYEFGAIIYGIWGGVALLLLLMGHVWYPFLWSGDNNMLIKVGTLVLIPIGFIWIYNKILFTKYSTLLWTMFAYLSQIACIVDLVVTLWNIKDI